MAFKMKGPSLLKMVKKEKTKARKNSGNLKDVVKDVRTKAADAVKKFHSGFDKAQERNVKQTQKNINRTTGAKGYPSALGVLGGLTTAVGQYVGKEGGKILENVIRPGKQYKKKKK
tara:strand:- start:135 stop:482 length:348 start_codon:yes stop_codon:yes gene_type:complete